MRIGRAKLILGAPGVLVLAGALWLLRGSTERLFAIRASGGEPLDLAPLATPHYRQRDPRWAGEEVGGSHERLARVGCTVCSLAMALDCFGVRLTPKELNDALIARDGYTPRGWLKWDVAAEATGAQVALDYIGRPRHDVLDRTLRDRRPAIVKVYINGIIPHWVLVVGKNGTEYLIRDPLGEEGKIEPLSAYAKAYALRTLRAVPAAPGEPRER